ncbi:hypothetical protein MTR_1g089745 [Medicago truncatula]|uniref:Uncharacterized protein n=1 Tax=Medicago truncatula TaxID=3880 RepID=A0A072VPE0_MEDTR|nr:hypothetical protein MTR_1g089745 [Medicago truncatula]
MSKVLQSATLATSAYIIEYATKLKVANKFNTKIKPRSFMDGELVPQKTNEIFKLLYLDYHILLSTEVVTRLSHDHVALFKTFRGTAQNCARQTNNNAASRIKQAQLQLYD